jgi:hypothetical protein
MTGMCHHAQLLIIEMGVLAILFALAGLELHFSQSQPPM